MKIKETKMVTKPREETYLVSLTCDKCDREMMYDHEPYNPYNNEWFKMTTGMSFPEGGSGKSHKLDLCEECAKKMLELLKENGYKVYEVDWDF